MKTGLSTLSDDFHYAEYRRRLDARAVLDRYGIENDHEETTSSGETEVVHSCLIDRVEPHHNNGDRRPSASCNIDRKLYICYAYWGGDLLHLIQKMEGAHSFEEIVPIATEMLTGATLSSDEWQREVSELYELLQSRPIDIEMPSYSDKILSPWSFVHPYLEERGIDIDTASRLKIGWRDTDNRIIIPHFWNSSLVGWQARAIPDRPGHWPGTFNPQPKYLSTTGFPKADTFYHDHTRPLATSGEVIVVESPFSVIKAVALGLKIPVLATFGAKVSKRQIAMLSDYDRVYLWPDPDPAGQIMEMTVKRQMLSGNDLVSHPGLVIIDPDPGMDLADYDTLDEVQEKIETAIPAVLR